MLFEERYGWRVTFRDPRDLRTRFREVTSRIRKRFNSWWSERERGCWLKIRARAGAAERHGWRYARPNGGAIQEAAAPRAE